MLSKCIDDKTYKEIPAIVLEWYFGCPGTHPLTIRFELFTLYSIPKGMLSAGMNIIGDEPFPDYEVKVLVDAFQDARTYASDFDVDDSFFFK